MQKGNRNRGAMNDQRERKERDTGCTMWSEERDNMYMSRTNLLFQENKKV
jgi:hypothetical protein